MNYEEEIFNILSRIYSEPTNKDKYGQTNIYNFNINYIKKNISENAFKFLENGESRYGKFKTYGNKYQIYKALNLSSIFFNEYKQIDNAIKFLINK